MQAACQAWGLDPAMGFFHEYHPGRDSLACDLMEPFRVPAVDRLVLRMLALKSYHQEEFVHNEGDFSVRLIEEALRRWATDLEMHLHAADEDHPSLQVQIVERVGELVDVLPSWNGRFPGTPDDPGSSIVEGTFLPPPGLDESDFDPSGGLPEPAGIDAKNRLPARYQNGPPRAGGFGGLPNRLPTKVLQRRPASHRGLKCIKSHRFQEVSAFGACKSL